MATKFIEVAAWVIVDGDENWVVGGTSEQAAERYEDEVGSDDATPRRVMRVTIKVPVPQVVELAAGVPEEGETGELKVA